MEIKIYPDPILREMAVPVEDITDGVVQIGKDMMWTMRENRGIGLSAQQVGLLQRIMVIDTTSVDPINGFKGVLINPTLLSNTQNNKLETEGCLSFPKQIKLISRPFSVKVKFVDENRKVRISIFTGITARCFLHELDHLNGKLFIDYGN